MKHSTAFVTALSDCGRFKLWDIYDDCGKLRRKPILEFLPTEYCHGTTSDSEYILWDNSSWLLELFQDMESRLKTKDSRPLLELKSFCKENGMNYKETRKTLRRLYIDSFPYLKWNKKQ